MSSFTPGGEPRAKPGTRKEMGTHGCRQRMGRSRMGFSRAASYSAVWEETRNLTLCCNKTSLTKWELSDDWSEISGGADYSKPQEKKLGCLIARHNMHKPTLFTQPACIYIGRFGISVSFLHVSGTACKPAVSATRRIRLKKPETRDLNFSRSILTLTLEALQRRLNIFRLLIKVRRVGSFADIYRLGNTFFCF